MKKLIQIPVFLLLAIAFTSCKKDSYKNDGGQQDPHVNMTTYDYLRSKPVFTSLVKLIDRTGLKDAVNGDITFFATTNYGVDEFVVARKNKVALQTGNENITFTLDSLPAAEMKDSLQTYMFKGKIGRDQLTTDGKLYNCLLGPLPNTGFLIRLQRTFDYNAYVDHVDYVNLAKIIGTRDDQELNPDQIPQDQRDVSSNIQTSGIITTTGILHVMDGRHRLFFNADPLPR